MADINNTNAEPNQQQSNAAPAAMRAGSVQSPGWMQLHRK